MALAGCVQVSHSSVSSIGGEAVGQQLDVAPTDQRIAALAEELTRLGQSVDPVEAAQAARVAVQYSEQLADWYGISQPVELHNVLVNLGMRRGGLCYELAECMLAELEGLKFQTLSLHRGIAWKDDIWNEHNCVVITAKDRPFESGLVLDAWRNAGKLRWAPVRLDHYPWHPKPEPEKPQARSNLAATD